jgi:hypothetical protein
MRARKGNRPCGSRGLSRIVSCTTWIMHQIGGRVAMPAARPQSSNSPTRRADRSPPPAPRFVRRHRPASSAASPRRSGPSTARFDATPMRACCRRKAEREMEHARVWRALDPRDADVYATATAMAALNRIHIRRAKLLGLDSPAKLDVRNHVRHRRDGSRAPDAPADICSDAGRRPDPLARGVR